MIHEEQKVLDRTHGGIVVKSIGAALMAAVFGAPKSDPSHAFDAAALPPDDFASFTLGEI